MQQRIDRGEVTLNAETSLDLVVSVLKELDIPASSQALVFSKTSFQRQRISPSNPRAVYFSDDVYVGYFPGGEVPELAAADPKLGAVFYVMEQQSETTPRFLRQTHECLSCHSSGRTLNIPGRFVRPVFTDSRGNPLFSAGGFTTDHTSLLEDRWGGWYVTGTHAQMTHMGNAFVTHPEQPERIDRRSHANQTKLPGRVSPSAYPSDSSDIVALMVPEHQTQTHSALAKVHFETVCALDY